MTRVFTTELFGKKVTYEYAEHWVGYSLLVMRVVMGWVFLQAGLSKMVDPTWSAAGYLQNSVVAANPFHDLFASMAGSPVVDWLVVWGLTLVGIALIFGAAVRFATFWGVVIMTLFWASHLLGPLQAGFPIDHGWFVSEHVVNIIVLIGLASFGSGKILGVDGWLERKGLYDKLPWTRALLS